MPAGGCSLATLVPNSGVESSLPQSQGKTEMRFPLQSSRQAVFGEEAEPRVAKLLGLAAPLSEPGSEEASWVLLTLKKVSGSLCSTSVTRISGLRFHQLISLHAAWSEKK